MIPGWLTKLLRPAGDYPEFWKEYLASFQGALGKKTPIGEVRFVVFDTETTGLDLRKDYLLSVGAVSVQNWQIDLGRRLECYVQRSYRPSREAVAVHGILPGSNLARGIDEIEAMKRFVEYCHGSVLAGHHVGFDIAMVDQALRGLIGRKLANKRIDTAALARRVSGRNDYEQPGAYGLDALCRLYNIPMSDRHTAAGDAFITAILLMKLLARLKKRGVHTLGDLMRGPVM